jgi:lipopolysaccharide transport system permease protein
VSHAPHTHVIVPRSGWAPVELGELWEYRELVYLLVWRDVKIRYKQTVLGVAWAVLQPVLTMVIFSIFFGKLGGLSSDGYPYPIFAYCALLPWQLFAFGVGQASESVVLNQRMITKVYFPRVIMPMASVAVGLVDFAISFLVLLVLMAGYHIAPSPAIVAVPVLALVVVAAALGAGLWLSALNVTYRDVRHAVPFLIQVWFFATPVAYATSSVPPAWRMVYALVNPMVGVIDSFRWALLGAGGPPPAELGISILAITAMLVSGLFYFRRMERRFADVV